MAIFISSGTLGLAIGPTYFSAFFTRLGLGRSYWAALPGILITLLLLYLLPEAERSHQTRFRFDLRP